MPRRFGQVSFETAEPDKTKVVSKPPKKEKYSQQKVNSFTNWDLTHGALDVAGMVPALGIIPDLLNSALFAARGEGTEAAFRLAAALPIVGQLAITGRHAAKVKGLASLKSGKITAKTFDDIMPDQKVIDIMESNLRPAEKFDNLVEVISKAAPDLPLNKVTALSEGTISRWGDRLKLIDLEEKAAKLLKSGGAGHHSLSRGFASNYYKRTGKELTRTDAQDALDGLYGITVGGVIPLPGGLVKFLARDAKTGIWQPFSYFEKANIKMSGKSFKKKAKPFIVGGSLDQAVRNNEEFGKFINTIHWASKSGEAAMYPMLPLNSALRRSMMQMNVTKDYLKKGMGSTLRGVKDITFDKGSKKVIQTGGASSGGELIPQNQLHLIFEQGNPLTRIKDLVVPGGKTIDMPGLIDNLHDFKLWDLVEEGSETIQMFRRGKPIYSPKLSVDRLKGRGIEELIEILEKGPIKGRDF